MRVSSEPDRCAGSGMKFTCSATARSTAYSRRLQAERSRSTEQAVFMGRSPRHCLAESALSSRALVYLAVHMPKRPADLRRAILDASLALAAEGGVGALS